MKSSITFLNFLKLKQINSLIRKITKTYKVTCIIVLSENKKGLHFTETLCSSVTASGFKPETPSSVVRYSIQLSYAAIPRLGVQI